MVPPGTADRGREDLTPGRFVAWYGYNALFVAGVAYPLGIVAAWAALYALGERSWAGREPGMLVYTYLLFSPAIPALAFFYVPFAMALARWNPRLGRRAALALSAAVLAAATLSMAGMRSAAAPWVGIAAMLLALALGIRLTPRPPRWWAWGVGIIPVSCILMFIAAYAGAWLGLWS